jgi:hypothetical protein
MAIVLEGGYDLVALEAGLEASIDGMLTGRADDIEGAPDADRGVARAATQAARIWKGVS